MRRCGGCGRLEDECSNDPCESIHELVDQLVGCGSCEDHFDAMQFVLDVRREMMD